MKLKSAILSTVFLWSIFCESGVAQVYRIGGGGFGYGGGYGGGYGYSSGIPSYGIYGYGTGYQTVGGVRIVPVYYRVPVIIIRKKACDCETAPTSELRIPTREEEKQAEKNESILPPEPPKPGKTFQRETPEPPAKRKPETQPPGAQTTTAARPGGRKDAPRKDEFRRQPEPRLGERDVRGDDREKPSEQNADRPNARRRGRKRSGMRSSDGKTGERRSQESGDDRK